MRGHLRGLTSYGDPGFSAFARGAYARGFGLTKEDLEKPIVGIAQTWSELNPCHRHLREIAEAVKRGVWQTGGLPLEFPTISLGEMYMNPTAMFFRNLLSMDTEEMIKGPTHGRRGAARRLRQDPARATHGRGQRGDSRHLRDVGADDRRTLRGQGAGRMLGLPRDVGRIQGGQFRR